MAEAKQDTVQRLRGTDLAHSIIHIMDEYCAPNARDGWSDVQKEARMAMLASRFPFLYGQDYEPNKAAIHAYWGLKEGPPGRVWITMKRQSGKSTVLAAVIAACMMLIPDDRILLVSFNKIHHAHLVDYLSPCLRRISANASLRFIDRCYRVFRGGEMLGAKLYTNARELPSSINVHWVAADELIPPPSDPCMKNGLLAHATRVNGVAVTFIQSPDDADRALLHDFHRIDLTTVPTPHWFV
jgi:hypothetical protein